jgi:hypothetical protein
MVSPAYIRYLYTNDRFKEVIESLEAAEVVPNSDIRPVSYQLAMMLWLSRFFPGLASAEHNLLEILRGINPLIWMLTGICVIILIILLTRLMQVRKVILVGCISLLGMITESVGILYYQVNNGVLYQNLGIFIMAFMAGLSLGSFIIKQSAREGLCRYRLSKYVGVLLIGGFIILNTGFTIGYHIPIFSGIIGTGLFLLFTGFLVSGTFAYASLQRVNNQNRVVSPLYASDLIGGSVGSILASLFLIPLFGLPGTTFLAALSAFLLLFLL